MKLIAALLFLFALIVIARGLFFSFRAQDPSDYAGTGPAISLTQHLNGEILSEGLIYGPMGRVTSSFTARMEGSWNGETGTLTEAFTYSNGNTQNRKWTLTLGPEKTFTARADDVVGEARGTVSGSTIRLEYTILLPQTAGGHRLNVTDWLYLTDSGVILNRSEFRKFGIKVAELIATMRPAPAPR